MKRNSTALTLLLMAASLHAVDSAPNVIVIRHQTTNATGIPSILD